MTDNDTPPGVRLITDGGTDRTPNVVSKQANAEGVETMTIDGAEREVIRTPISSTRSDRENDEFSKGALEDMAAQIRDQKPLAFQNHGLAGSWMEAIPYDQAETIGTHHDAEVVEADDGEYELISYINPDGTHAEGERMLKQVRDEKQAIKFSVGFSIHGYEEKEDDAGNTVGRIFTDVDLMEDSKVGIPANPDASVPVGASAKSGTASLPGYQMHPMVQMMRAVMTEPGTGEAEVGAKMATPDGGETREEKPKCDSDADCPDGQMCEDGHCVDGDSASATAEEVAALRGDVNALREEIADLKAGGESEPDDKAGDPCDDNGDCPEGEVCVDGECVPEDEVDDDDEEEDSASATTEELESLQAELDNLREELKDGRGDPQTKDTATEEPDLTETGEPDADKEDEPETSTGSDATGWLDD